MAFEVTRRPSTMSELGREVIPLRTMMDRVLESAFTPSFSGWSGAPAAGFGWDVFEDNENYYFHAYLAGVDASALDITVQDNVLSVSGETKRSTPEGWRPLLQEMTFGQFQRQFTLGAPVESARAEADYRDGILRITLPKAEAARPRHIKVNTNGAGGR
jgi:HSP20 family protein